MKISSTSRRASRSVSGPKSVIERSTRSAIDRRRSTSGSSSPSRATRWYSSTARRPRPGPRRGRLRAAAGAARSARARRAGSRRTRRRSLRHRRPARATRTARPVGARATRGRSGRTRNGEVRERGDAGRERPAWDELAVHAARSTRRSVGTNVRLAGVNVREISPVISARRYRSVGARFTTRCTRRRGPAAERGDPSEQAGDTDRVGRTDADEHAPSAIDRTSDLDPGHARRPRRAPATGPGRAAPSDVEHLARPDLRGRGQAREPAHHVERRVARCERARPRRRRGRARPRRSRCAGWARSPARAVPRSTTPARRRRRARRPRREPRAPRPAERDLGGAAARRAR